MNDLTKKIKLSIPIVTLYQNYASVIDEIASLDKSTTGEIKQLIESIPEIISVVNEMTITTTDDAFKAITLSDKYDNILSYIYVAFDSNINKTIAIQSTTHTLNKSEVFVKKVMSMFREILAMYNKYSYQIRLLNNSFITNLVKVVHDLTLSEMDEMYTKYPNSLMLYGYYIQSKLNQPNIGYNATQILMDKLNNLKNNIFGTIKQEAPSKINPPLQNMGCIPRVRNKTLVDIIQLYFKKSVSESTDEKTLDVIASELKVGVLILVNQIPGNYIYDVHTLLGWDNADKYKSITDSCITDMTLEKYNTIIEIDYKNKPTIHMLTIGDTNSLKWIVLSKLSRDNYDLMYKNNSPTIHKTTVDKMLRGSSIRIQGVNMRQNIAISSMIVEPNIDNIPGEVMVNTDEYANKLYNAVTEAFIKLINEHKPTDHASLKRLIVHPDLLLIIRNTLLINIDEFKEVINDDHKVELTISAMSDVTNIIDNFILTIENAFNSLKISSMIFQEKHGDMLYDSLITKITPIYLKVFTEILLGKTNIFANIREKNNKLNTTQTILYT